MEGKDNGNLLSKDLPAIHIYDIAVHRLDGGLGIVGTGKEGTLRIAVFATHTDEMLDRLLAELRRVV